METTHKDTISGKTPAWEGHEQLPFNLVLEGGAMRGLFTAGVLDFLMDEGVVAQEVIGVSAGALMGFNYVAGATGRSCYLNTKYCTDWRYMSMRSFALTGNAVGEDFFFHEVNEKLEPLDPEAFRRSPMKLTAVTSDIETGEAYYPTIEDPVDDVEYLRATSAMPLLSKIVEVDDRKLLDGGVCDSVPLVRSMLTGVKKQVVVLTQDPTYVKPTNKLMALARQIYSDYPYFIDRMQYRHFEYNRTYRTIKRLAERGDIFVIQPSEPVTVSSMEKDPAKLLDLYEKGLADAAASWDGLRRYLEID